MATATHVPRINNNDDEVKLVGLQMAVGDRIAKGQVIAQVETDKAVVDVEASGEGYVLAIQGAVDDVVQVGSVLCWTGATADEAVPASGAPAATAAGVVRSAPTAKAAALLAQHGLDAAQVPAEGERLTVADIERFLAAGGTAAPKSPAAAPAAARESKPEIAGQLKPLKSEERGMLATVLWHRDTAVPGYVEMGYDPAPWDAHAAAFGSANGLLLNPLLPLMAWRLVELAVEDPRLNATVIGNQRHEYDGVNLGFTVQAGDVLYLAVLRDAAKLGPLGFVNALVDLQRRAAAHKLGPNEVQGTTIGFSSMARWKVSRHVPILSPHTAIMVAHAQGRDGAAVLGAAYDHRVLNGSDVAGLLRKLSKPPKTA
jgi:pyruvate/2-oxoglutarate dehydrogenase complex dihydrolipoamide acyltransferase (E2) component